MTDATDITRRNTVKHWVLYTLDAVEASTEGARGRGVVPDAVYEHAGGDDSIVFTDVREVAAKLSEMAREGNPFDQSTRPVNRRSAATDWDGPDVLYRYRLTDLGRAALLDLGTPSKRPNRNDLRDAERALDATPGHEPGWWQDEASEAGASPAAADRIETDVPGVVYASAADRGVIEDSAFDGVGARLADVFADTTFVLRGRDAAPAGDRGRFHPVILDVDGPTVEVGVHTAGAEAVDAGDFGRLVYEINRALQAVRDEYGDAAD